MAKKKMIPITLCLNQRNRLQRTWDFYKLQMMQWDLEKKNMNFCSLMHRCMTAIDFIQVGSILSTQYNYQWRHQRSQGRSEHFHSGCRGRSCSQYQAVNLTNDKKLFFVSSVISTIFKFICNIHASSTTYIDQEVIPIWYQLPIRNTIQRKTTDAY